MIEIGKYYKDKVGEKLLIKVTEKMNWGDTECVMGDGISYVGDKRNQIFALTRYLIPSSKEEYDLRLSTICM